MDIPAINTFTITMKLAIKKRSFLKKTYIGLSLFVIGLLHLFIVRQVTKPTIELKLALVRNEFLDKPPTKIVVLGEFHSGHEYAAQVLRDAFGNDMTILHDHVYRHDLLDASEMADIAERTDVLWVMTVRSPCEWADSIIQYQKELCNKHELPSDQCTVHQFASPTDYYRVPWYDMRGNHTSDNENIIEISNSDESVLQYDDIFDMRQQKLLLMKQIMDAVPRHVKILRPTEFELNPDVFVKDLVKEYSFTVNDEYKPPAKSAMPKRSNSFSCMEYSKWKEAQQRIDWTLEGYFGYHHLDCHLCRDDSGQLASNNGQPITTPSNIYILGERNSGTTFVSNTLAAAFDPPNTMGSHLEKFSSDIPVLLHKHMFRHDLLDKKEIAEIKSRDDILWIMVVRSPCDWAEGMFRKPYHLCPPSHPEKCGPGSDPNDKVWMNQNSVAGVPLLKFFTTMEWNDWAESVPFLRDKGPEKKKKSPLHRKIDGEEKPDEEVSISKVSANYTYPNVFHLRRHKLRIMKQIIEAMPRNVKFVRLKELERSPEMLVQSIVKEFNMTVKDGYKEQSPSPVAHPTVCLTPAEWDAAQSGIDWNLEAEFGFSPFDCRMCYGYEKSTRLYNRVMEGKKINKLVNPKLGKGRAKALKGEQDSVDEEDDNSNSNGNAAKKKKGKKKKVLNALDGNLLKKKNAKKKQETIAKKAKADKEE